MTALHMACQLNHVDSVAKLVHAGADRKARDNANKTPLDYVFHDSADPHANPFYNYLHALLMDDASAQKNRIQNLKDKIESRYTSIESRITTHVNTGTTNNLVGSGNGPNSTGIAQGTSAGDARMMRIRSP